MRIHVIFVLIVLAHHFKALPCKRLKIPVVRSPRSPSSLQRAASAPNLIKPSVADAIANEGAEEDDTLERSVSEPAGFRQNTEARKRLVEHLVRDVSCPELAALVGKGGTNLNLRLMFIVPMSVVHGLSNFGIHAPDLLEPVQHVVTQGDRARLNALESMNLPAVGEVNEQGTDLVAAAVAPGKGLKETEKWTGMNLTQSTPAQYVMVPFKAMQAIQEYLKTMPGDLKEFSARDAWKGSYTKWFIDGLGYAGLGVVIVGGVGAGLVGAAAAAPGLPFAVPGVLVAKAAGLGHLIGHGVTFVSAAPLISGVVSAIFHGTLLWQDTLIYKEFVRLVMQKCFNDLPADAAITFVNDTANITVPTIIDDDGGQLTEKLEQARQALEAEALEGNAADEHAEVPTEPRLDG